VKKTYLAIAVLALLGVLAIAGCGGGGSSSSAGTIGETESASTSEAGGYGYKSGGAESGEETEETKPASEKTEGGAASGGGEAAVVEVADTPDLGNVIVDAEGMTLYDFHKDKGTMSSCYGACAEAWPPLLTEGKPQAMAGAEASLIGTTKRKDGTEQVTYKGHPVYGFVGDKKPGETNGNDVEAFGAEWYALEPNGEEPDDD
jgi:predicted lipoprotein with Yx(FWY)xxD motif